MSNKNTFFKLLKKRPHLCALPAKLMECKERPTDLSKKQRYIGRCIMLAPTTINRHEWSEHRAPQIQIAPKCKVIEILINLQLTCQAFLTRVQVYDGITNTWAPLKYSNDNRACAVFPLVDIILPNYAKEFLNLSSDSGTKLRCSVQLCN
ncbi:hypothetical protein Bhyg_13414 [Pseudolycoriella hygida]|uniref:Uncharacterized protein n=1 Tax=Pseudolycoriella hygida TaxID=35572 RepID=A0A9Q0MQ44_9DIPT|nr:hypothetical protein Bhyg_13414 [Pseudolycoriella hygida]